MGLPSTLKRTSKLLYYNTVSFGGSSYIVDLIHHCGSLYEESSELGKSYISLDPEQASTKLQWKSSNEEKLTKRFLSNIEMKHAPVEKMEQLGKGVREFIVSSLHKGFGSVWRCNMAGFTIAVKEFAFSDSLSPSAKKKILKEVELLQKLEHPNIISYIGKARKDFKR